MEFYVRLDRGCNQPLQGRLSKAQLNNLVSIGALFQRAALFWVSILVFILLSANSSSLSSNSIRKCFGGNIFLNGNNSAKNVATIIANILTGGIKKT